MDGDDMANVLVIKNANFTENRVAVVAFDGKPCTGIEFDETSISVSQIQDVTIEYTVTPTDTTDDIIWTSSNTDVATVANGVVSVKGIGEAIISATCGNYSASLTITSDLYASPNWFGTSGTSAIITDSSDNSIVRINGKSDLSSSRMVAVQSPNESDFTLPLFDGNNVINAYPIAIPDNATKMHIDVVQGLYNGNNNVIFMDANESVTYAGVTTSCEALSTESATASSNKMNADITIPSGANSFIMDLRLSSTASSDRTPDQAAEYCGVSIHFLTD